MTYEMKTLHAADYDEAMDFINMVFSMTSRPIDFPIMLPAYYQPDEEHMQNHHALLVDGKIRALIGIYPAMFVCDKETFKVARIGAVSVHPRFREQGLMKALMTHCLETIQNEGYDFSILGGRRHRYLFYGYERVGTRFGYTITKSSLKHSNIAYEGITVQQVSEKEPELMRYFLSLHDRSLFHAIRKEADFYDICRHWNNRLYAIYDGKKAKGYLVYSEQNSAISEIVAETPETALKAIACFFQKLGTDRLSVSLSPFDHELLFLMSTLMESTEINAVQNLRIFHWENTIATFLSLKQKLAPLEKGSAIIGIQGNGTIRISVNDSGISCTRTIDAPKTVLNPTEFVRILFGPLPPYAILPLPDGLQILNSWCPLPFYVSAQDFA